MTPSDPTPAPPTARERQLSTMSQLFVGATLAAWVCSVLPYPWRHGTLPLGAVAVGLGIWALVLTFFAARSLLLRIMLAVGVAFASGLAAQGLVVSLFEEETRTYEECVARAITMQAQAQCERDRTAQIEERLGVELP